VDDVTISGAALLLFSGILTAVIGAMVSMFHLAWRERDRTDARVQAQFIRMQEQYDVRYREIIAILRELTVAVQALKERP
jgi:hypothetical protein